jgi:DNA-binding NtrC family response regulator
MKVLVIDDEEVVRSLVGQVLSKAGFDITLAESGVTGLDILSRESNDIDLVLLDWTMPELSGLETLREIKSISPDMPCIISSGYKLGSALIPEDLLPNTHFLEKPYRAEGLLEKVGDALGKAGPRE